MKAFLKNYRQAPRKVRLVANVVRGKDAVYASTFLRFMDKRAAPVIKKLIDSALANAVQNNGAKKEDLMIKEITVDEGITFKRYRPRERGRSAPLRKMTSRISVTLGEKVNK